MRKTNGNSFKAKRAKGKATASSQPAYWSPYTGPTNRFKSNAIPANIPADAEIYEFFSGSQNVKLYCKRKLTNAERAVTMTFIRAIGAKQYVASQPAFLYGVLIDWQDWFGVDDYDEEEPPTLKSGCCGKHDDCGKDCKGGCKETGMKCALCGKLCEYAEPNAYDANDVKVYYCWNCRNGGNAWQLEKVKWI